MTILIPAYGRDYKSKKEVEKALKANIDFQISDISSKWDGSYGCLKDFKRGNEKELTVRYGKLRKVLIYRVEDL